MICDDSRLFNCICLFRLVDNSLVFGLVIVWSCLFSCWNIASPLHMLVRFGDPWERPATLTPSGETSSILNITQLHMRGITTNKHGDALVYSDPCLTFSRASDGPCNDARWSPNIFLWALNNCTHLSKEVPILRSWLWLTCFVTHSACCNCKNGLVSSTHSLISAPSMV